MSANRSYTILAVDDQPMNLRVLSNFLSPLYRVKVANSGKRALEILAQGEKPDLVLLDIMMPEMSGFEVCRLMKSDPTLMQIPVIFVTGVNDSGSERIGLQLGAVDYITKPLILDVVLARVATHLSLHNQQIQLEQLVAARTQELSSTRLELVHQLGRAGEFRDNDTGMHVIRMAHYARLIAEKMGTDPSWSERLFLAAPLHDIGKIGIPDSILLKPGKLDPEEWEIMQRHSEMGARIIGTNQSDPMFQMAYEVALHHHEAWNGKGYPYGLKGKEIPIAARIVSVSDVFDALVSERPYKKAWSVEDATQYINEKAGSQLDPEIVDVFNNVVDSFTPIMRHYVD